MSGANRPPQDGVSSAVVRLWLATTDNSFSSLNVYAVKTRAEAARCMRDDIDRVFQLLEAANDIAYELDPESEDEWHSDDSGVEVLDERPPGNG